LIDLGHTQNQSPLVVTYMYYGPSTSALMESSSKGKLNSLKSSAVDDMEKMRAVFLLYL
jgi:hypothetical protein